VTVGDRQLGKAGDNKEAREMWQLVASATNKITTSAVVICQAENYEFAASDNAFVTFKPYDEAAIEAYLATDDWRDKAGAWSIQKCRSLMEMVEGDIETIVGLPTRLLVEPLAHFGISASRAGYQLQPGGVV
jgi:septum formation protein